LNDRFWPKADIVQMLCSTGRGCNTLTGWFVVDSVTYNEIALTAIDLRFEQHCEGDLPALHGEIHWVL